MKILKLEFYKNIYFIILELTGYLCPAELLCQFCFWCLFQVEVRTY